MTPTRTACWLLATLLGCSSAWADQALLERPEVQRFVQETARTFEVPEAQLRTWLLHAQLQPRVIELMERPYEAKPWHQYRPLFVNQDRIERGVVFWQEHEAALEQASAQYGVPPEIMVAILGVETKYGRILGHHKVLDALATLGFDYPPRQQFFRKELSHFLKIVHDEEWKIDEVVGSYAGAFGMPQFMPSSYRAYAVALEEGQLPDIIHQPNNAIASIAHYFQQHHWHPNEPVTLPTHVSDPQRIAPLIAPPNKPLPYRTGQEHFQEGVFVPEALWAQPVALLQLEGAQGPEYWLGLHNFYVITRYNHSQHYAMAVLQLAEHLKAAHAARG